MPDNQTPNAQDPAVTAAAPEETIDGLKLIIVGLTSDKEELAGEIAQLKAILGLKDSQILVLTESEANLKKELSEATSLISGQHATLTELTAQLEALQANPSTVPTFTLDKKTYEVHSLNFKYRAPGAESRDYTLADLLSDKKLQSALVKKGVGFITLKE